MKARTDEHIYSYSYLVSHPPFTMVGTSRWSSAMSDHAKPEGASADALPRIAIVDWTDSEWTGGGRFWKHTQHMFEPLGDGAYRAKAADMWKFALRSIRHDLPVSFSLERVGWLAPGTDVDWAVANRVRPLRALAKLAEHYDLLFARASVVVDGTRVAADISRVAGKAIVGWIVEPPPFDHTHLNMAGLKAAHVCSACAWAHFTPPNRNVRYRYLQFTRTPNFKNIQRCGGRRYARYGTLLSENAAK